MYIGLHVEYLLFLSYLFKWIMNFIDRCSKIPQISNFMKICPVGAELFHDDRRTYEGKSSENLKSAIKFIYKYLRFSFDSPSYMTMVVFAFRNYCNVFFSHLRLGLPMVSFCQVRPPKTHINFSSPPCMLHASSNSSTFIRSSC